MRNAGDPPMNLSTDLGIGCKMVGGHLGAGWELGRNLLATGWE